MKTGINREQNKPNWVKKHFAEHGPPSFWWTHPPTQFTSGFCNKDAAVDSSLFSICISVSAEEKNTEIGWNKNILWHRMLSHLFQRHVFLLSTSNSIPSRLHVFNLRKFQFSLRYECLAVNTELKSESTKIWDLCVCGWVCLLICFCRGYRHRCSFQ